MLYTQSEAVPFVPSASVPVRISLLLSLFVQVYTAPFQPQTNRFLSIRNTYIPPRTATITMMQPVTFEETKVQEVKTDVIGSEEYRGNYARDGEAAEPDFVVSGDSMIEPDVYYGALMQGDPEYDSWSAAYDRASAEYSEPGDKQLKPKQEWGMVQAYVPHLPKRENVAPKMAVKAAKVATSVAPYKATEQAAWMKGDPDYANFGAVMDKLSMQAANIARKNTDRLAADPDYDNWQKAYDRIASKDRTPAFA